MVSVNSSARAVWLFDTDAMSALRLVPSRDQAQHISAGALP